jgi:serine protease Do
MPLSQSRMPHSPLHALRRCAVAAWLTVFWVGAAVAQQVPVPESFADLAQAKLPSVVTVTATSSNQDEPGPDAEDPGFGLPPGVPEFDFPPGSPFEEFFKRFGPDGNAPEGPARRSTSLGSGFIIDPTGYIVTNNHVVTGADEVKVVTHEDRAFTAEIIGTDPKTDLALLKIEADGDLPAVTWGNSDQMRIGDWVVAIGNPFGLGGTVTAGILSARARDIGAGPYDDFLQTDAAINRGNSGGPLFNMTGEVIGVSTAIFSQSGGNIGIGFAVPSEIARPIIAELRESGKVTRGWLGVTIQPITPEIAQALGLDQQGGALVAQVTPDSPAARAGMESGDVIVQFDGRKIDGPRDLSRMVAEVDVGTRAGVTVLRNGDRKNLEVTIRELEETRAAGSPERESPQAGALGLTLAPLTPETRERFGVSPDAQGTVVVEVAPDSPAATRDLRPGDLITQVGRQRVERPGDVAAAVEQARKANQDHILLLRSRDGNSLFVPLPIKPEAG